MDDPYMGTVILFAGSFAPQGWAFCDGRLLPINQYTALYSLLGTVYGGDGHTTFGLPDLRGRVPLGAGAGPGLTPYEPGNAAGVENVTLSVGQMPMHRHAMEASSSSLGNGSNPSNAYLADSGSTKLYAQSPSSGVNLNVNAITQTGGSQPHENRQPFLAMNYIIALVGLYPPRP